MKAVVFEEHGGPEVLQVREAELPETGHTRGKLVLIVGDDLAAAMPV